MFDINEFCRVSKYWADKRIAEANENRKNGVYDPLNELTDSLAKMWAEGKFDKPLRKSQKHRKRKVLTK